MLLQNSVLLNRVTQSSISRIIGIEVGASPKPMVDKHLLGVKRLLEQKSALDVNNSMSEYTNPGPIINNVYVPTRNGKGTITSQTIGGDYDPKSLVDLDYYENLLFGALRVPKQYFGRTDDSAGFSGGQSLAIISSRYAKAIKRIQNVLIQMITDAVNLMCIDKGLDTYVNNFTLKMQAPTTQEEVERRDNTSAKIQLTRDVMDLVDRIDNESDKLKILKSLLSESLTNTEVLDVIQTEIDRLDSEAVEETTTETSEESEDETIDRPDFSRSETVIDSVTSSEETPETAEEPSIETSDEEETLPTPSDLNLDLTDYNAEV